MVDFTLKKAYNLGMRNKILIVDFMYLWNRIYAIKGAGTGAHVYMTLKNADESDYYFKKIVVLDGINSTDSRRKILPDYKGTRSNKSEIYAAMSAFLKNNAANLSTFRFVKNDKYEADDIITRLVKSYLSVDKYIYSGDTDLYQLLRFENTYIGTNYSRGMIIKPIENKEATQRYAKKYNLKVEDVSYIVKCKTFKGDTSDNIPIACPGMRSATINTLIEKFWGEDEPLNSQILLNMAEYLRDNCKESEFNNFFENRKAIIRNYKLVQLGYEPTEPIELLTLQESGEWE